MALTHFVGILCVLAIFVGSGFNKITQPEQTAAYIAKSHFQYVINTLAKTAGVPSYTVTMPEYVILAQVIGALFVSFSALILLNVGRRFFATLLALGLILITACMHVNLKNPAKTEIAEQVHCLKNLAIIGGLFLIAAGPRVIRVREAAPTSPVTKNKKAQ